MTKQDHITMKPHHIYNGETTSHNDKTTPRNGETTSHNGKTTSHNGKTTSHNDESTSHNAETTAHNDKTTSRNGETPSYNDETTSHNDETTSHNVNKAHRGLTILRPSKRLERAEFGNVADILYFPSLGTAANLGSFPYWRLTGLNSVHHTVSPAGMSYHMSRLEFRFNAVFCRFLMVDYLPDVDTLGRERLKSGAVPTQFQWHRKPPRRELIRSFQQLVPERNDGVMADNGFNIDDLLRSKGVQLNLQSCTVFTFSIFKKWLPWVGKSTNSKIESLAEENNFDLNNSIFTARIDIALCRAHIQLSVIKAIKVILRQQLNNVSRLDKAGDVKASGVHGR
ncbi:hypothetical protein P5673_016576 [Acropora cervicornis]|uniref:Uncharacterized protein n=1 Tax=Acropora cervicornis TaxID=6130 RepID=A0AAD9QH35_ACRCE|nr:hypothetical protein P5673_016576 [Acropora cervicornis]